MWWDGWRWVDPAAPPPGEQPVDERVFFPDTPTLALPAAWFGIAFISALTVATRLTELLPETAGAIVSLVLLVVSTLGMPLAAWYGSRRWGTGHFFADVGLRVHWLDVPFGMVGAVGLTIALIVYNIVSHLIGVPDGSNLTEISEQGRDVVTFAILFVMAVLLAPPTEELLFRGLIQRGLDARFAVWPSVVLQGAVFGAAHITPSEGWGNVNLCVGLALMGVGLGSIARATGRLGTPIIAHSLFNAGQLGLLWLTMA